jgi:hypothetical protein
MTFDWINMQSTDINEIVEVGAVFGKNKVKPKWFIWHDRKYEVKEVTYVWHDKQGEAELIYFALTDGKTIFEVSLNQKDLSWRLLKTTVE